MPVKLGEEEEPQEPATHKQGWEHCGQRNLQVQIPGVSEQEAFTPGRNNMAGAQEAEGWDKEEIGEVSSGVLGPRQGLGFYPKQEALGELSLRSNTLGFIL